MNLQHRLAMNRFLILGRVGMDLNADPPGIRIESAARFTTSLGGSAGNIAAGLARQGAEAALLACVSNDPVGRFCVAEMTRYGIGADHVRVVAGEYRNSLALTETVPAGCQTVIYRNGAADFALSTQDVEAVDYSRYGALVVTGTALAVEPSRTATRRAMELARAAGALVVLDVDYRAYSWASLAEAAAVCREAAVGADVVVGNDVEFALLAGNDQDGTAYAATLVKKGAWFAVYKIGPAGCRTFTGDYAFDTPVYPVVASKPTGAGDGFVAGLLAALAQQTDLEQSVRRGAATAAIIVSGIGCASASPDSAELDRFMATAAF